MTFIGPSQREQTITSTHRGTLRAPAKTRFNNAAQSRRYADRGGDKYRFVDREPEETAVDWREPIFRFLHDLTQTGGVLDHAPEARAIRD